MNTLETSLELPVTVEYDCLDEGGIEIIGIQYYGSQVDTVSISMNVIALSKIQYDNLIDQINADLESQKQEALDFQAESMRDDSKHNPNW